MLLALNNDCEFLSDDETENENIACVLFIALLNADVASDRLHAKTANIFTGCSI
jgi:hypothetical protein